MRRKLMILATLAAVCGGASAAFPPAGQVPAGSVAYTANELSDSVTVIDLAAGAKLGTDITVGNAPYGLALSPAGDTLYVSDPQPDAVLKFVSTATRSVAQSVTLTGASARDVAVTPDGAKVYVALHAGNAVSVVDVATHAETKVISTPTLAATSGASGLAMTPDGTKLYVINDVDSSYCVISTATDTVTAGPFAAPTGALRGRVSPAGDKLMIVGSTAPMIVSTTTDHAVATTLTARGAQSDVAIAGSFAYVCNSASAAGAGSPVLDGDAAIDIYDLSSNSYVTSFSLGSGIQTTSIVVTPDGSFGWVACLAGKGSLQGLDLVQRTESGAGITTGFIPRTVVARFPTPETIAPTYFLPTSLVVKIKGAGKDSLSASGLFDEGTGTADFTQAVAVTIGAFSRSVTLSQSKPGTLQFKDPTMKLVVKPRLKGSSRGSWTVSVAKSTLAGAVPTDGDVDLSFAATGLTTATARAHLAVGSFRLGKKRGALVAPAFFPSSVLAKLSDTKPDSVSMRGGFAANGSTPAALGAVSFRIGPTFVVSIAGASFVKSHDVFKYSQKSAGGKVSAQIDFARGTVSLTTTGVEAGTLPGPTTDVAVDLGLGAGVKGASIRLAASGAKRTY